MNCLNYSIAHILNVSCDIIPCVSELKDNDYANFLLKKALLKLGWQLICASPDGSDVEDLMSYVHLRVFESVSEKGTYHTKAYKGDKCIYDYAEGRCDEDCTELRQIIIFAPTNPMNCEIRK